MQEDQEMKRLLDGDDELSKSAKAIFPYLKATLPIRTKNVDCTVKTTNSKGYASEEPLFIYPWGFSQILLNCPDIKPPDIEYFITNIRAIYPHIQIKTIEKSYPHISTKGNHSTSKNTEKWLAVQEHDPFLTFVQQWEVGIPASLDLPQHLMVPDAVKLYLYLCLLEQSEGAFPLVEVEKAIANIKGKNQIPAEFMDMSFEQMFRASDAGFIDRVQSDNGKKIIYVLGRCCYYANFGESCNGIHAIVLDPAIATELRKGERLASNDVKTAIISSFMDYLKEDPTNALSRKTALNSLRKQLGGDRYSAIKTEMLGEQARQLLEGDGWLKILPDGRAILAKDRSIDGIDTVLRDLESDLAKHPTIWWGRDINIKVAVKPISSAAVEEQRLAEKEPSRVEKRIKIEIETKQPIQLPQAESGNITIGSNQSTALLTFPTTADQNQTDNILGRGNFAQKFVLGKDPDKNQYITMPWNGKETHLSLFCGTGMGKSTLASSIVLQSIVQRIPVVIFDPKDGWGISLIKPLKSILDSMAKDKREGIEDRFKQANQSLEGFDFSKPIRFTLAGKDYEIKYNLFTFDENVMKYIPTAREYKTPLLTVPNVYPLPGKTERENAIRFKNACDMVATEFVAALNLRGEAAFNTEISGILQSYQDTEKLFFTRDEFIEVLEGHESKQIGKKDMEKLIQGVHKFCTANSRFIASDDNDVIQVKEIFNNPFIEENGEITISVFDLQSIGAMSSGNKSAIMTMYASNVTGQIFDYINRKNPPRGSGYEIGMPKVWLVYDEAHNLIEDGKTTSNNNIKRVLQEGRSLGAYAAIISQKPQNVDITARAMAKNRIYAEVTWESIVRDLNIADESLQARIKEKIGKSKKSTKLMTFINEDYPEGQLMYPLSAPQAILAKTDILNLFEQ